jgi:peptide/nickel transport system substrate-binding protein
VAALVIGGLVLGACSGGSANEDTSPSFSTEVLRIHLEEDISNLDPAINPGHTNTMVAVNIFENLVAYRPDSSELVNELAETFEVSDDGLRYDFTLREGIQFHGGYGEMTAEDVKFSFERIAGLTKPAIDSPYQSDWEALKEVEVHDKYSGTIVLKKPSAAVLATTLPYGSGRIVSKKAVDERGDEFGTQPIGTGPYEFVHWKRNQEVVIQKFDDYGNAREYFGEPVWEEIRFPVISEANPALIALQTDELDFATLAPETTEQAKAIDGMQIEERTTLRYNWLGMNMAHPNFQDKDVRLAVINGIDVDSILAAAFDGQWTRANSLVAPGMPLGYWEDAPVHQRDVEKAREHLAAAGAEGMKIEMQVSSGHPGATALAEVVQANLNEVGFDVKVDVQESGAFNEATKEANAEKQLFYMSFGTKPDPSWSTVWFTCEQVDVWNWMSWCNEEYDALHEEALTETDPERRHEMYVEMQQIMEEDAVALWVAWPTAFYAAAEGLEAAVRPDGEIIPWAFTPAS